VDALLASRPDYTVENPAHDLPQFAACVDARGFIHLLPHRDDADAVFIARLRRLP
jgi:16S rRNA C967 or C1407 C5-methylase (RsmB/RsmF family)